LAVQSLKSGGSFSLVAEVDVSETLERTSVTVGGERDTGDVAVLSEDLLDALVAALEGDVAEEEGVAGRATLVAVLVATGTGVGLLLAGSAEVDVQLATVELELVHLLLGLGSIGSVGELNVTETIKVSEGSRIMRSGDIPLGAAGLTVSDDTAANDLTEALELATEPVFIDVPAHVTNEEVLDALFSGGLLGLGLLNDGLGNFLSLALLGGSLFFVAVGIGVRVGGLWELVCL
jgi:hypothetical protein